MSAAANEYVRCLLAIATDRIAKDDRACCICFDEYGKRKPDGRIEYAAALPQGTCGHIFGHLCLAQWLERDGRCPLCRFVVFGNGKDEVDNDDDDHDDDPARVDLAEPVRSRVALRGGGRFEDDFSDHSTDEEEFETLAAINETLRGRAIAVARPATLDEVDEAGAIQPSLGGLFFIRGFGLTISIIWKLTSLFPFRQHGH